MAKLRFLLVAVLSVFLPQGLAVSEECPSDQEIKDTFCGLPEVVAAASTKSIKMKSTHLVHGSKVCKGDFKDRFRTADGTCNNAFNKGSANTTPARLLPNAYDDGVNAPRTLTTRGFPLPPATDVSRVVHPRRDANQRFTVLLMQWGQFMDHDLTAFPIATEVDSTIRCCGEDGEILNFVPNRECFPILLGGPDINQRFVGECMEFARSIAARDSSGKKIVPREQVNSVTSFIDGSMIYGSSQELQEELRERTASGKPGFLMRTSANDLLPPSEEESCNHRPGEFCFLAGDARVNEQPGLAAIHTLFVRLHNQFARELRLLRPRDTDEEVFQLTRKIVAAIVQNIQYSEWLPLILGRQTMREFGLLTGFRSDFVPSIDPRITNAFSTAAFRFGHTLIPMSFTFGDRVVPLREVFNRPDELFDNFNDVLRALVRPLRVEGSQAIDRFFTEEITGHLFEPENNGDGQPSRGLDLVGLNIQRGRDHGLPPYNEYRKICGLPVLTSFDNVTDAGAAKAMRKVYDSVDDIDLFSGLMSEERDGPQLVGRTAACILGNQFHALKYGDRFYFETERMPEGFNDEQLIAIRNVTMAKVCCQAKAVLKVQERAFEIPSNSNDFINCLEVRGSNLLDLSLWNDLLPGQ